MVNVQTQSFSDKNPSHSVKCFSRFQIQEPQCGGWYKRMWTEPFCPVTYNSNSKLEIDFIKSGKCEIWEKPPEGYRYASALEVVISGFPDDRMVTFVFDDGEWKFFGSNGPADLKDLETIYNPDQLFQTSSFFVAVVKL